MILSKANKKRVISASKPDKVCRGHFKPLGTCSAGRMQTCMLPHVIKFSG